MSDWGPLGEVLARDLSDQNRANVTNLVNRAMNLLKEISDRFPGYTLHDGQHAANVVTLMGKLATPGIASMRPLEAALLILATYFHDAGMAYTAQERDHVADDEYFQAFLDSHDEAFLATRHNGGIPPPFGSRTYRRMP